MTPAQIEDLRRKAEAATRGPWQVLAHSFKFSIDNLDGRALEIRTVWHHPQMHAPDMVVVPVDRRTDDDCFKHGVGMNEEDAAYIAAANPAVVLELLDTLDEARSQRDKALRFAVQVWETDDPSEPIADNGATVWHGLQQAAKPLVGIAVDLGLAEDSKEL